MTMTQGELPKSGLIRADVLRRIADVRVNEAQCLWESGYFAGATYLAGYAVECLLKAAICRALGWEEMRPTFAVHDLEGLLLHSGLQSKIDDPVNAAIKQNFVKIKEVWLMVGKHQIRYSDPRSFTKAGADDFLKQVNDATTGVATWLRAQL